MSRTEQMISIQKKMEFKIKVSLQDLGSSYAHITQGHRWFSLHPCAPSPVVEAGHHIMHSTQVYLLRAMEPQLPACM